ncbi:DUF3857 domain-containing protein [Acidicapsa dinghuensis]|uniref:DUF3857 domain-containing protein n=1 Tax=Acidicapsa dinghuensis TaxID=2218256 RepID=A0ABW1EK71_9BACT|nr:DUF3857 domain-containing protein [Acidicapsa dinghuensis]
MTPALSQDSTANQTRSSEVTIAKANPDVAVASKYVSEPAVVERLDTVYSFAADGTGWKMQTAVVRIQSEATVRQLGVLNFSFASASERLEMVYLRVRSANGTVTETPASSAMEMPSPVTQAAPFYSDLKQLQVPVRNLQVGDRLEYQIKWVRFKAEADKEFWGTENFDKDAVVLEESLELHVPKDTYAKVWCPKNKAEESTTASEHVWRWTSTQLKPTVGKEAEAAKEAEKHHVLTDEEEKDAEEGKYPDVAWTSFHSWDEVGEWYRKLEQDRIVPDAAVKAKANELIAGKTTEEDKVKAVYGYVSSKIRYIGVDFGIGRYQPHAASEVLDNQYGDCKDKHTLLAALLTAVGVHSDAALIGGGVRFNPDVPSPAAFNHVITTAQLNGQQVWMDATEELAPFGAMIITLRDKQALVVPESGVSRLERTPAELPFEAFQKFNATGTLDAQGTAHSHLTLSLRGDGELLLRAVLFEAGAAHYQDVIERVSQGMGYAGTVSHVDVGALEDSSKPLTISYDYERKKPGDWDNLRIPAQLAPVGLPVLSTTDTPTQSIQLGPQRVETSTAALKLPEGWTVTLPTAIHAVTSYAKLDETYRFEGGTLYAERRIEILQKKIPLSKWNDYLKWAEAAGLGGSEMVQLSRASTSPSISTATSPLNAAEFISRARKAIRKHNFDEAQSLLDQAVHIDTQARGLWASYGYLEFQRGNMEAAIGDYAKDISLYPRNTGVFSSMAEAQVILGHPELARKTLERWASEQPKNPAPVRALMQVLLDEGQVQEALKAGEAGIAALPPEERKDDALQLTLGRVQLRAGKQEEGKTTLMALLQDAKPAGLRNDAAYELINGHTAITEASAAAMKALAQMTEESKQWSLDEKPETLAAKSRMLEACWDTVGWAYFLDGKTDQAKNYIHAAWRNRQSAEVGLHLGEIAEAAGDSGPAITDYELALASFASYLKPPIRKKPGALQTEIAQRREKLGADDSIDMPGLEAELKSQRSFNVSISSSVNGSTEYRLLMRGGKIVRAQSIDTKEIPGTDKEIEGISVADFWPKESDATLVHEAELNCHDGVCELVLEP